MDLTQDCALNNGEGSGDELSQTTNYHENQHLEDTPPLRLPPCELSKLEEIVEMFTGTVMTPQRRDKLASAIEEEGYIKQLLNLFHMCEDLENTEGLHHLYDIFKCIFTLNRVEILEEMFDQEAVFDIVGVLEYDPTSQKHTNHREYLRNKATFREVMPFGNQKITDKIHQTYRMQYIQDVILPAPSVFEENLLSTLSSLIYFNKSNIVSMIQVRTAEFPKNFGKLFFCAGTLQEDEKFLQTLFQQISDDELDDFKRKDLVLFLKELCVFSQTLQQESKSVFFKVKIKQSLITHMTLYFLYRNWTSYDVTCRL